MFLPCASFFLRAPHQGAAAARVRHARVGKYFTVGLLRRDIHARLLHVRPLRVLALQQQTLTRFCLAPSCAHAAMRNDVRFRQTRRRPRMGLRRWRV